jgi:hypothetical protein
VFFQSSAGDYKVAKKKNGVNKSEEIRQILQATPDIGAKDVVAQLDAKGLKVSDNLVYFIKGQLKGRKGRKKKAQKAVAKVAEATGAPKSDALATILKVKELASQVGGMKKLKALIEALSE